MSKQYGLIVPNKKPAIFNESDSASDEEAAKKPSGISRNLKRQDLLTQQKAVEEDPTVYQYDEVYDEIASKRKEAKLQKKEAHERKPKYIGRLLQAAERRKRENERRIEKQVQKEREAEGDEFKDKEKFVTSSYKKMLEEMKKLDEEEKREEYLESIGDVRKQGNLDGFYRHLYDQKVNYGDDVKEEKPEKGEKPAKDEKPEIDEKIKKRNYRKRASESEDDETAKDNAEQKLEHLPSNLDADSDFSIDSSDSEDEESTKETEQTVKAVVENKSEEPVKAIETEESKVTTTETEKENKIEVEEPKPKKPKIDIWKKRTVGVVFEEALQRYFERKALREAGNTV